MNDKRDQLYDNLINSGRVSENEIGNREQFKAAIKDEAASRQFYNNIINSGVLTADEIGSEDDFYDSISSDFATPQEAPVQQGYQPSAEEMAGFMGTINRAGKVASGAVQSYDRRAKNLQKRQGLNVSQQINLGESGNLVQGEKKLNPETGQLEDTYITSYGNEYDNKALADMEQRQIDQNERDRRYKESLPGQLDDAYAERDKIAAEIEEETKRVGYGQSPERSFAPQVPGSIPRQSAERLSNDRLQTLYAAQRQNDQRILALEAERDDDGGTQFWRGFIDAAKNPSTLTFGATDFMDMTQLMRIKNKVDAAYEAGQEPQLTDVEQELMQSSFLNNYAQQKYGENRGFMYRAGGVSMQALPFVAEFMATGGLGALSQKGAELGTRAAEKLALQGLSKTLMKNLGIVAGDVAAGWAMANTTGLFRTTGDVMQRNIGDVTLNPEGEYDFGEYDEEGNYHRGGKSLGRSIYEAEVANTLEYYTEKLGEHLQIGKWLAKGAEKMGLGKLSKVVNYLSGNKWLERGGIQDYPSEVVEEQANLLLNAMLVGDNTFSSPDDPKSVINPKTQGDIWGGMLFSIGLMQAPRLAQTGASAAGYYAYKNATDVSDTNASIVFGADNWQMIKEQIDSCPNEELGELLSTVINGDMNDMQKHATMSYAGNLIKMRGYNMGMMAGAKDEKESMSEKGVAEQTVNQSYVEGHETQEPDLMKQFNDEAQAAAANLPQYGEQFAKMVTTSQNPVRTLSDIMAGPFYTDEQTAAAADYYQKMSRVNGVMDGALSRIDLEVERQKAEVRANTHQATGNVYWAKGADDVDYNVIGGDIMTDPDTGLPVLTGTAGAVIVRDQFGNISVKSPQELTMYSMRNADELINGIDTELRQQLMQQADDDMTYGSPANEVYQLEDTVTLQDGDGNVVEGEIGMMPNSVDGVYVVYTPDGKALQYTADQLNRMIVNHNGMEVQRATPQDPVVEAQQPTEQQKESTAEDPVKDAIIAARNGDVEAQNKLNTYGISWEKKPVVRFISQGEFDSIMNGNRYEGRFGNGRVDVTNQNEATTAASADYRVTFKDELDWSLSDRLQMKNEQLGDGWLSGGYGLDEVATIEKRNPDGTYSVVYDSQKSERADRTEEKEQPQSALSRIPVLTDEKGKPVLNRKGKPQYQWHKASVEDAAAALIETTGGDMLMARDTASDLVANAKAGLEKIRKQKPKGDDPIEIAESRMEIKRQEQEQQAIIKQWQDVNQAIQKQMRDEAAARQAEIEAAKSAEQKAKEAEEARIRKEKQDAIDAERRRKKIEEELANWSKPYAPLAKARKDMEGDTDAMDILNRTEPETLEEWVSSLIQPQSMMWDDETDPATGRTVIGLQSELGLQKKDIERIGGLVASRAKGGKPFGQVVHDIWEQLPEGMKNMYDDQDVRNALIGLFGEGNAMRMRHLTEEHRIEEAREMVKENLRREAEAELEAWAESYHLTPEERETFEDYLAQAPSEPEIEIINNIIADNEYKQSEESAGEDQQPVGRTDVSGSEGGESQVQQAAQAASDGNHEAGTAQRAETPANQQAPADDTVPGPESFLVTPVLDIERSRKLISDLTEAYWDDDVDAIRKAAKAIRAYVDEGGDFENKKEDLYDYDGADANLLALQYKQRVLLDRHLDDDEDQEYIRTGLKPQMRQDHAFVEYNGKKFEANDCGVCINPNVIEQHDNPKNVNEGFEIRTALTDNGWVGGYSVGGSTYGGGSPVMAGWYEQYFKTEAECQAHYAQVVLDYLKQHKDAKMKKYEVALQAIIDKASNKTFPVREQNVPSVGTGSSQRGNEKPAASKPAKSRPGLDTPEGEILVKGGTQLYTKDGNIVNVIGSNIDHNTNERRYTCALYESEESFDKGRGIPVAQFLISQKDMRNNLQSGEYSKKKPEKPAQPKKKEPKRLVSDEKMEELRKQILAKLNNLNAGVDPEMMLLGGMYAVGTIERGVTKFADYAKEMISALGDKIRPYLKAFYNSVRDMPGAEEYASQLDDYQTVASFDVHNFDKQQTPDVITKAEQVVTEQRISKQAKKIKTEQPDLFTGDLFGGEAAETQQQTQQAKPIGKTSSQQKIKAEEAKVDTNPSEAQKEAGNYQKGHINIDGYDITIENPKGSIRRGTDANGNEWQQEMHNTYGYIRGTEGVDGDHIDVFLSDNPTNGSVFVVDQINPSTNEFDEHKVMYGFGTLEEAREAYLSNYSKGWKGLGDITEASRETFKEWINSSHRKTKPFAEYALIKKQQAKNTPKTAWWSDPNRPKNLDPSDYKTYTTDEAKAYFANYVAPADEKGKVFPDFTKWAHPNLAYITAAAWDGAVIPIEELMAIPEIQEAEKRINSKKGSLNINESEQRKHVDHLLDAEHGSQVYKDGKKVKNDYSGPVRQERKAMVVIGRPAGGKSSVFADGLSHDYGARIVDSDVVKPWLEGYDDGYGAGYVQTASAKIAEQAMFEAARRGDNMIIPRIGGNSVIEKTVIPLIEMGYDVQLYYNDVSEQTSVMRAASRFAEEGRYLSLQYLTTIKDTISKTFSNFAEKKLGEYYDERDSNERPPVRDARIDGVPVADGGSIGQGAEPSRNGSGDGLSPLVQEGGRSRRNQAEQGNEAVRGEEPIFSYVEWKSNDVPFGEKPKEIWNSESGKPMPTNERTDNENKRKVSTEPQSAGEGTGQASGSAGRAGAEPGTESDRTQRTGSGYSVDTTPAKPKQDLHKNKRNNQGERGKDYAPTSLKARFNANVEAIKMMRALMEDGVEAPTKDQMEVLRQYSGWGGMGTYFNDESSAENKQLRDLLSDEEYNDAVMSINSAYFTPANVIDSMWDIAKAMGFKGGNVLEGSAGIGNIIGQMPTDMSRRSDIEAVEIDKISGNILKLLYPDAKVHIQGFQDTVIPNGSVDLAITNVPFVTGLHVFDKVDKDLSRRFTNIHDFCIAKNIRKLREGGIGIFISSSGTLDKSTDLRQWITDEGQADVVGAFRLNNETFGGTTATSDIIVVRKRTNGQKSPNAIDISKASPLRVGSYEDKYGDTHQVSMVVNDYFADHPENMAGDMAFGYEKGDTFRPGSYGLYPAEGKDQQKMLDDFVKSMGKAKEVSVPQQQTQQTEQAQNQLTAEKEGRMLVDDNGRLCVSQRGVAVPLGLNDQKVKGYSKQQCFEDYQAVQKAVDDVLQQQLNDPDDAALKPKLDALNKTYDKFTKRYGTLHKNTAISFLRNDIDFPSFQALENYSETKDMKGKVTIKTAKAPLFSQRVLGFKTEPKPKTIKDALIASIFRSNGIDLAWIADRLNDAGVKPPHKDQWDEDDVRKGILVSRLGFEDPSTGQLEIRYKYLSGNVREKLAIAEGYNTDGKYSANVEELRKAVPMDIPSHLIDFSLGSSWIPTELYKEYLKETLDLDNVKLSHVEGTWVLDEGFGYRNEKNRSAGVYSEKFRETIYGHQLVAAALNNRPVKVSKQQSEGWGSSKTTKTVVDQAATQACAVRVDEIKDEFKQWAKKKMQDNPELAQRIEKIYNDKFNALVPMKIDDEFLPETFDGANMNISLYEHQKRGVMRGLTAPTMLAHEVGTGKSFTLISTAMEMRRLGTAKKPMIVVQNATVAQLTSDAKLLYPNAKVLSLSEKDRTAEGRRAFYAKIKFNDWDLIIVPQSTFERIPDSPERELQFIQEKIDEKKHVIEAAQAAGVDSRELQRLKKELQKIEEEYGDTYLDKDPANGGRGTTTNKTKKKDAKREAASLDKAETKAKEQLDRAVDDVQFFDDLGVDALLIDEAHEYKHLGFQTSIGRGIKGIDPSYSKKCAGLYNKTRSVFEKAGWKNVVFATGTPISNTAAEIWTFMKYLMPADVMKQNDIYYFDDFVHNFGNISQMLEFATSGKFKENTRFAAYVNKPELIRIWSQVADTVLTKEVGAVKSKVPEKEGGKDQDVFLPQSPSLISIMAAVRAELERFENMDGKEKKENSHIPLTMYGIAKRAAIDPRLVDADAPDEPLSKTNAAVKEIVKDLNDTKSYKGTVAVFCENQNRKGDDGNIEFNIYDDMREKLIAQGVPADQIAIIKSGMSIAAKQKVFDAVNSGAIRVVLGSTQTLGTGVNMQERLHLLIHMDAPDRPMDYTQRNGRIERQGNLHKVWGKPIRILRFGVEDSLDVTAYQRLKTKSGFIDSIMDGKSALANNQVDRTVEEEEEGLFDNPVAVLSGSQYALKKNQAERELRKYQGKKAQWEADQVYITNTLRYNKSALDSTKENIDEEEKKLAKIKGIFPDGKVKAITVEGVKVDMTKDDGAKKLGEAIKEKINDPVNATVKKLRENEIYNDETHQYTIELDGHPVNFTVSIYRTKDWDGGKIKTTIHKGTSYASPDLMSDSMMSARSVKDYLEEIIDQVVTGRDSQDRIEAYQARIERINQENEQMSQREGQPFQFDKELEQARKNVEEYTELMKKEMEEKEAKYAQQQKEAEASGNTFNLAKAEESSEEDELYRADEDEEPVFFSNALLAVESIRQEKATPEQWLSMITKNSGMKAGEDKWLGLSEWLQNNSKRTLTKDEIIDYISQNQIDVEDVHYVDQISRNQVYDAILDKKGLTFRDDFAEAFDYFGDEVYVRNEEYAVNLYNQENRDKIIYDEDADFEDDERKITEWAKRFIRDVVSAKPIHPKRIEYTTYGLRNNREIALIVPTINPYNEGDEIHFGYAGGGRAVAWIRFGETTDREGHKVLVIDEIQSKRHQDARNKGYKDPSILEKSKESLQELIDYRKSLYEKYPELGDMANLKEYATPEEVAKERELTSKANELEHQEFRQRYSVPSAPFEKNWHELAMKRMLRYAAENGYDYVAWTTGEQQADRYNIGQVVDNITAENYGVDENGDDITAVDIHMSNEQSDIHLEVDKDGIVDSGIREFNGKHLSEIIGKDAAKRILEDGATNISGDGLTFGREGMRGFYDQMLPRFMDKYGKKWGVQVHDIELPQLERSAQTMHSVEVTPAMKQSVMMGQPMFREIESFPIRKATNHSSYNVLGTRNSYSVDLLPDEYATQQTLLDEVRNVYPEYYVTLEDGSITMQSWESVMTDALNLGRRKKAKGTEDYVERKTRQAINAVNQLAGLMGLNVEILTTTEGLEGKKARAKGFFNPKTGKITIVLPNHSNQSDLIRTLLHEGVAHFGLRKMFGVHFDTFLDNVYNNAEPQIKARIDAAAKRNGWSRHTATEEYLARLAERTDFENATKSGWWKKIKDFFVRMLAEAGIRLDAALSDNDLRYILWRSYDNLLHPNDRRNIFDKARDVQMQSQLRVGDYAERGSRPAAKATPIAADMMRSDYSNREINDIVEKAKADGTYMKAPNGQPSNLNELQWAQVRTKAFKDWFGDWENDPENASKVVDENREPKVMYHKTNLNIVNKGEPFWIFYEDSHFGTKGQANDRVRNDEGSKMYEVFLNIRNPQRRKDADQDYLEDEDMTMSEYWQLMSERSKRSGHDGIVYLNEYEDIKHPADSWIAFKPNQIKSATENSGDFSTEDDDIRYSLRTKEPSKKTGKGYKVFVLKNGQLYPPMVANPNGDGTPIGVWLDADAAPVAGTSKTGRPQVKAGGKGTQGGSGQLAYRPGWHLGTIPYALQFNRKDENGERTLFPNNFVWAEVEYANDKDYQQEAHDEGVNANGKYQHSLAGLKRVPVDGSYKYRTNPDPNTDEWIITGAMRVNKILSREEVDELVRKAGREPQKVQDGDVLDQESVDALNEQIQAMKEADEMGLLYSSDDDEVIMPDLDDIDIARNIYEEAAASDALKFQESWQDKMAGLKILQNAIEKETGNKATGAEDAYLYENRMHGKAKNQSEAFDRKYYQPILKAADKMMKAKGWTDIKELTNYMVAKHGLERNIFYAFKEAVTADVRDTINKEQRKLTKRYERGEIDALTYKKEQKKLEDRMATDVADKLMEVHNSQRHTDNKADYEAGRKTYSQYIAEEEDIRRDYAPDFDEHYKDYSGLTELTGDETNYRDEALAMVDDAENDAQDEARDLWDAVNAATKETLRFAYESGTMSRNTYNNVRAMFDYYIPLRGWAEDNANDFYDYVSERNVFSSAIKKAYGRKSLAENPIAYIGNMAVSTLLAGHRNQMKQRFLNYVMNNPTSLVSVSEKWWENKGTETSPYWVEVAPEIPANATADEIADIVEQFNKDMQEKAEQGKATTRRGNLSIKYHATGAEKNEHMVEVQRAGKTYQLYINGNPKAAQALNGINEKAVSRISQTDFGKLVERINRNMAAFFTSKNPAFVLSNLSRDLTMAGASVAIKEDAAYNAQFIKNVWKVLRPRSGRLSKYGPIPQLVRKLTGYEKLSGGTGLMPSLMRKYLDGDLDLSNETERLFGEFMDEGAETGFVNMLSVDSFKEKMQKEISHMQGTTLNIGKARKGTKETPIGKGLRMMGDIFEFYNRCAEDATRFIVYMTSRQMGKSLEDSIADAKDVTLNFNRKGTGSQWNAVVRDLFIFVNPAIQALSNMFKMAYKHPIKFTAVTAGFVAAGAMIPIFNQWLLNLFGDDDDKDAYWNLPPWVRKNNLVLWVPGTKNFITIPLAQEFRVFYGLGEMMSSLTYDHPVHEWPMEILSSFMDLIPINPTGNGGNLAVDLTPTMLQPLMQLHDNVDFTGKPIWKENQGNKHAPMYTKTYITTPEWMVALSEAANDITGGNEGKKGWIEEHLYGGNYINNPAVWNHLMQGYFGGMYNTIAKGFDVITTGAKGEVPKVYQTPILNRFLNRPVERDDAGVLGDDYYSLIDERDKTKYELRTWQKKAAEGEEGAQEHVDEIMNSDDYQRMLVIDHYDKIMKDLKAGEKAATMDVDKADIKESITMYKAEMLEELAAIDGGDDPLAAAKKKFDEAKTFAEKNRLRMRIEKLMARGTDTKKRGDEVQKALSYRTDEERESRKVSEDYLRLATAEMIEADARIRVAKAKIKTVTDEYKQMIADGRADRAQDFRQKNAKYFKADEIIKSQSRNMTNNKKLLGKGHDAAIMKLIDLNRNQILKAIEGLE